MTKESIEAFKREISVYEKSATRIMEGGENYDGADGAREVLELCEVFDRILAALEAERVAGIEDKILPLAPQTDKCYNSVWPRKP